MNKAPCPKVGLKMSSPARMPGRRSGRLSAKLSLAVAGALFLSGCGTLPSNIWPRTAGQRDVMKEVMERKDRIVILSSEKIRPDKPVLLLLHGATDDASEMMRLGAPWVKTHNVLLYSYNYHHSVESIARHLVREMKVLRAENRSLPSLTVITYSYSAIVFRKTVLVADDPALFSGASLVQLVPTAGGSSLARSLWSPFATSLVNLASKASAAESPYGSLAEALWDDEGQRKFCEVINPRRVTTVLVEADAHSLANNPSAVIQRHYKNGIGRNVVVIPKNLGVTHENFPNHPLALAHLKKILESGAGNEGDTRPIAGRGAG